MATWASVIPVCIVLGWAAFTHQVTISLLIGILSAAYIATPTEPLTAASQAIRTIYEQVTAFDNILVFLFLICIGIIIELMRETGAIQAYITRIQSIVYTPLRTEVATLLGTFGFFLDDYLNAFTLGAVMGPLFDTMRIPRTKLAYLLNATVPSLCILIPATTWAAMILSQFRVAGIGNPSYFLNDPFITYLSVIVFALYPICSIITAYYITLTQSSFGSLHHEEKHTQRTPQPNSNITSNASIGEFFLPIITFIVSSVLSFLYTGNAALLGGNNSFLTALQEANSFLALGAAAAISTIVSIVYFYFTNTITLHTIQTIAQNGYLLMQGSLIVLILAWSLSDILTHHLHTAEYLADVFTAHIPKSLLPVIIFLLTSIITASTGSAWGTIALMVPLTIQLLLGIVNAPLPLYLESIPHAYPTIAAVLAGAIAGGHFSPISDATIVASASSGASHITHVKQQMQYSLAPLIGAICGYTFTGYVGMSYGIVLSSTLAVSITITLGITWINNRIWQK